MPSSPKVAACPLCGGEPMALLPADGYPVAAYVCDRCNFQATTDNWDKVAGAVAEVARLREALVRASRDLDGATESYAEGPHRTRGERLFNRTTHAHARVIAALGEGSPCE